MNYFTEQETKVIVCGAVVLLIGGMLRFIFLTLPSHIQPTLPARGYASQSPVILVNINTANVNELKRLTGIGPTLAYRIFVYRRDNGPFVSREQLLKVKGITKKIYQQIYFRVTL